MNTIQSLGTPIDASLKTGPGASAPEKSGPSFGDRIAAALQETDRLVAQAESAATGLAQGSAGTVETMVALSKAELALRHVVSMSTRALDAYREVMRMQL